MHAAFRAGRPGTRRLRGLHDLKLAANDRGSGGLTSIRPFLPATFCPSFHCFQQCVCLARPLLSSIGLLSALL